MNRSSGSQLSQSSVLPCPTQSYPLSISGLTLRIEPQKPGSRGHKWTWSSDGGSLKSATWIVRPLIWGMISRKKTHDSRVRENSEVVIIYPKASYPTDSETKSTRFPQFLQLHLRLVWRLMAYSLEIKKKQRTWPVFFLGFTSWFCRIYDGYLPVVSHFASWKPEGN